MANEQSKKDLLESLVDIRDVKIDRSKPVEERMKSYVEQIKNPLFMIRFLQSYKVTLRQLWIWQMH